jgi:hypothetical protein
MGGRSMIESYCKFKIASDQTGWFTDTINGIRDTLAVPASGLLRADLFANQQNGEAIAMVVYQDEQTFIEANERIREAGADIPGVREVETELLGRVPPAAAAFLGTRLPREHQFAYGIQSAPTPLVSARGNRNIEICTQFQVTRAQLESYKQLGADMIKIVRQSGQRTLRFDWF